MTAIRSGVVLAAAALLFGCGQKTQEAPAEPASQPENAAPSGLVLDASQGEGSTIVHAEGVSDPAFDPECRIATDRVAGISMPATLGDFLGAFPEGTTLSFYPSYMVDFGALCARADGEDAICAVFESNDVEQYDPSIPVLGMAAYAPQCRTAEGVGPGVTVERASEAYGEASFSFNYANEGREYVRFANAPEPYSFRARVDEAGETGNEDASDSAAGAATSNPNGPYAGDYAGVDGDLDYFETDKARPGARIWEVWVAAPIIRDTDETN